jgi:hypothetical protein
MLEMQRGQGNRHFQMSKPISIHMGAPELLDIASASLACRAELI